MIALHLHQEKLLLLFPNVLVYSNSEGGFVHPENNSVMDSLVLLPNKGKFGLKFSVQLFGITAPLKKREPAQGIRKTEGHGIFFFFFTVGHSSLQTWLSGLTDGLAAEWGQRASSWFSVPRQQEPAGLMQGLKSGAGSRFQPGGWDREPYP